MKHPFPVGYPLIFGEDGDGLIVHEVNLINCGPDAGGVQYVGPGIKDGTCRMGMMYTPARVAEMGQECLWYPEVVSAFTPSTCTHLGHCFPEGLGPGEYFSVCPGCVRIQNVVVEAGKPVRVSTVRKMYSMTQIVECLPEDLTEEVNRLGGGMMADIKAQEAKRN